MLQGLSQVKYRVQKPTCSARESTESRNRPCWCSRANPFDLHKDEMSSRVSELRMPGRFYGYPSKLDKFYYSEDNRSYIYM